MGTRRNKKLIAAAEPLMAPGEQVELIALAKLGSAPVAANTAATVASAAISVAAGVLGGGVGFVAFVQREVYILLTNHQVLFFAADKSTGAPGKHLASIPRANVAAEPPRSTALGLFLKLRLIIQGTNQPLLLTFPPIPPSLRATGRLLAAAFPPAAT